MNQKLVSGKWFLSLEPILGCPSLARNADNRLYVDGRQCPLLAQSGHSEDRGGMTAFGVEWTFTRVFDQFQ